MRQHINTIKNITLISALILNIASASASYHSSDKSFSDRSEFTSDIFSVYALSTSAPLCMYAPNVANLDEQIKDCIAKFTFSLATSDGQPGLTGAERANALRCRGATYLVINNFSEALSDFTAALEEQIDGSTALTRAGLVDTLLLRGNAHYCLNDYLSTIADATIVIDMATEDYETDRADAFLLRAHSYKELKDTCRAIEDFTAALAIQKHGRDVVRGSMRMLAEQMIGDASNGVQ